MRYSTISRSRSTLPAAVLLALVLFLSAFRLCVYAADSSLSYVCTECGAALTLSEDGTVTHPYYETDPDVPCSHSETSGNSGESWVQLSSAGDSGSGSGSTGRSEDKQSAGEKFVRGMLDKIFAGMSKDAGFLSAESLLMNSFTYIDGVIDTITASDWYMYIVATAFLIMLFRCVADYSMEKVWDMRNQTPEQLYRPLLRFVLAVFIMMMLPHMVRLGLYASQAAFMVVNGNVGLESDSVDASSLLESTKTALVNAIGFVDDGGVKNFFMNMGVTMVGVVTLILPFLLSLISSAGIFFVCFSRVLEICVQAVFAPLAMTDAYKDFDRSHGMRYLMGIFGLCFQSVAIIVVLSVSDYVMVFILNQLLPEVTGATDAVGIGEVALFITVIGFAKMIMVFKTASIAQKAFGAQ